MRCSASVRVAVPAVLRHAKRSYFYHGLIGSAQAIAAHESPRTTKLYDRTSDEITLDEVERIAI
jgi:hypothetical protein